MKQKTHHSLTDEQLIVAFENMTLKPSLFSHEAHLRLAWIHIIKDGKEMAISEMKRQIKQYAESLNVPDKYNETITVAAVESVYHFMQKSLASNFDDFIQEFPRLKNNFKEILAQHYGINVFSDKAKLSYIPPDLLPFD